MWAEINESKKISKNFHNSLTRYTRSTTAHIGIALLLVVGFEALILLQILGLGYAKLEIYDYQVFEQLGINLIDQTIFSMDESSPYSPTLFRSPAYPAYIALIYGVFGRSLMMLRLSQFLLLWLTAWVLYKIAARYVDLKSAAIVAFLCATYPPFVFVATLYVAHSLTLFLAAVIVLSLITLRAQLRTKLYHFFFVGLAIAIMTLARPAFQLILIPAIAAVVMLRTQQQLKRRFLEAAVLVIGFALLIGLWIVRNNQISGNMSGIRIVSAGGWSLYTSAQQYKGEISYRLLKPEWDVVVSDFNQRNLEAAKVILASHDSDGTLINPFALAQREILIDQGFNRDAFYKFREITFRQFISSYASRFYWLWSTSDMSPWQTGTFHRFLQIYHVLLTGLVLIGCFLNRKYFRTHALLWMFVVYQTLLHIIYHVEARYTFEARLFLLIYAGLTCSSVVETVHKKFNLLNANLFTSQTETAMNSRPNANK
jgi:4-amino-4-deoxy-L-arabinose transferase-like glycosyltransferase